MPYTLTWEDNGLYWKWSGHVDLHAIIQGNSEIVGKPEYEKISFILWDGTDIDDVENGEIMPELSASFASQANRYNKQIKVAFVAQNKQIRELLELYIHLTDEKLPHTRGQQRLFMDLSEARNWVDAG